MNVSGIRPGAEFYECSINTIKNQEIEKIQPQKDKQTDTTYAQKEFDGGFMGMDVLKAINTMKKDQVIHQYQFFVGNEIV